VTLKFPSGLTLLTLALLVLLPALALLQYRWVGQVSDGERDRMQRNLKVAADQFREEFDGEIARAFLSLQVGTMTAREGASDRYSDRYDTWVNTTAHPQIVANIFLVDADGPALRLRRWHADTHAFLPSEWPDAMAAWHPLFDTDLRNFLAGRASPRRTYDDIDELLVAPLRNVIVNPPPGSRPQEVTPVFGFTVLQLDRDYIQHELLPELTRRHFIRSAGDTYRIAVVTGTRQVLYKSTPEATTDPAHADASEGLLWHPEPLFARGPDGPRGRRGGDSDDRWHLVVQHSRGSLEAAVSSARRRNLAISFGMLLLLTISVALLAITSRRAQRLARQQMEFVAGVSHELRTPIAVIRSAAENLAQGVVAQADRVKRYGQMMEAESRRLGEMVERVLQYAGIEAGLGLASRTPMAPGEIVESAIDSALSTLGPGDVHLERHIAPDLPPVIGDAAALRSAVQNLIANAVKYGGTDRWVGVRADEIADGRRRRVRITVSDHGAGIPASERPHIFKPFYRGSDAVARQIHGNGLGLSLVARIVAAHNGHVDVTTRAGSGSTFTIVLPAASDAQVSAIKDEVTAATFSIHDRPSLS
jgi:signal transduction histidine kinase